VPLLITNASEDPRFVDHPAWRLYGIESYIAVPFRRRDGTMFGVLCALDSQSSTLTEEVFGLFNLLADLIAFELEAAEQEQANAVAAEEAVQTVIQRDQFLSAIAHDLKNPLTVIRGHASLMQRLALRDQNITSERVRISTQAINHMTDRMLTAIDEVMDLTHMQLNRSLDLKLASTDLGLLVREVAAEQQTSAHRRIEVQGVESLVGEWDEARLNRVVQNLVGNALRYSPDGSIVTVTIARQSGPDGDHAVVRVVDQGVGIPDADLPHIFEQFRRGSNVINRIAGSGVGLFSVRQIVEQHGGTITAESREGQGSTFTVRLPLELAPK
jgi:signal transduction histidine kinase